MREIRFRAKRKDNGEWTYGYVDATMYKDIVVIHTDNSTHEVDPETVGQYTGLKDAKGKNIYEGDIIQSSDSEGILILHEVRWSNEDANFSIYSTRKKDKCHGPLWQQWIDEFGKTIFSNTYDYQGLIEKGGEQ